MKILLDCSILNVGGSIQVGLSVLENAARNTRHQWHIVLSDVMRDQIRPTNFQAFQSVDIVPMGSKLDRLRLFVTMPRLETKYKPDIIFTIFGPAYWFSTAPHLQGFALPTMIYPSMTYRNSILDRTFSSRILDFLKKPLVKRADYLVVETETVREHLGKQLKISTEKIFVVRNSYSPFFQEVISKIHPKNTENPFTFLVPSSYYKHKNLESIPSVASELRKKTSKPFDFLLTLPENEPAWIKILSVAKKLGVDSFVRTAGNVPHEKIGYLYRESNAVLLPTLLECSTAVYPESFMAQLPLATSDLDFAHELCGTGAIYFDPLSPSDIAENLFQIIINQKLRSELVANGLKVLREKYPSPDEKWKEQMNCMENVIQKCLRDKKEKP